MKRIFAAALALGLAATLAKIPSASAAAGISQQQMEQLNASYMYLSNDYYQKVEPQLVLNGARTSMIAYLKTAGIKDPKLAEPHATADDQSNVRELQREVNEAASAYGSKVSTTKLNYAAISGVVGSVKDRYTVFLDPKAYAELNDGLDGTAFGGVGLTYSIDDATKNIRVENVIIDGPSDQGSGLRGDDEITAINDKSGERHHRRRGQLDVQQTRIQKLLRGRTRHEGQASDLAPQMRRSIPITITRDTIKPPSVFAKLLPGDIGYAQLSVFGQNTGS